MFCKLSPTCDLASSEIKATAFILSSCFPGANFNQTKVINKLLMTTKKPKKKNLFFEVSKKIIFVFLKLLILYLLEEDLFC